MTTVNDIDTYISTFARREYSESWDNDGVMLCGDISKKAKKAYVCLEINKKTAAEAVGFGADVIITHHPFIFRSLSSITGAQWDMISPLVKNDIAVLSYHTRLDAADGGVNDVLAKIIGLVGTVPFGGGEKPMGRVGTLSCGMTPAELARHIKETLHCDTVRAAVPDGCGERVIKNVAVLGGGGKDFISDAALCADAYITGDLNHNAYITACENGICVFEAGHYHTENPVVFALAEMLREKFPDVETVTGDSECPFVTF